MKTAFHISHHVTEETLILLLYCIVLYYFIEHKNILASDIDAMKGCLSAYISYFNMFYSDSIVWEKLNK